jgi:hypothetical protein
MNNGIRSGRPLEGLLVMAIVIGIGLAVAGWAAYSVYEAFSNVAAKFEAATNRGGR